jgi:hypothetical protein
MSKIVIGLAGVKTSGKSTVANMIKDQVNAEEAALADKLKNTCAEVFGLSREQFDKQELKEVPFDAPILLTQSHIAQILTSYGIVMDINEFDNKYSTILNLALDTPRKIAQIVGTEILRATGNEDIHCDNVKLSDGITVISDVRFPNELEYFNNKEGVDFIPLYIKRDIAEAEVTEKSHPSEKCVFEFSHKCIEIDNNGDVENTKNQIINILKEKL